MVSFSNTSELTNKICGRLSYWAVDCPQFTNHNCPRIAGGERENGVVSMLWTFKANIKEEEEEEESLTRSDSTFLRYSIYICFFSKFSFPLFCRKIARKFDVISLFESSSDDFTVTISYKLLISLIFWSLKKIITTDSTCFSCFSLSKLCY